MYFPSNKKFIIEADALPTVFKRKFLFIVHFLLETFCNILLKKLVEAAGICGRKSICQPVKFKTNCKRRRSREKGINAAWD